MTITHDLHTTTIERRVGDLEGRVALVTGAGSGIGAGCAQRLADAAATVILADLDGSAANHVAAEIGQNATAAALDVRDPVAVHDAVAGIHARYGRLDVALNIAGIAGATAPPADYPIDAWRDVLEVNLSGVFYSMKAEIELMLESGGGSIVNMASIYGLVGMPVNIAYTAAKHGVVGITRAAALAYAQQGIRVNAVAPAVIDTPLLRQAPEEIVNHVVGLHPIGRIGQISEVAELVAFLASDRSSFCTGGIYTLDGAFTAA
jgi:NAD(P)-dependent dehydrogenase (short-subunit alcohol dehydrogenase family)